MLRALVLAPLLAALLTTPAHAVLSAPAPSSPADGATVTSFPPFEWGKVKGADTYQVQVSADDAFGSVVTGKPIRTANTAATLLKSVPDGTYAWRVRAVDAEGRAGRWSAARDVRKAWSAKADLQAPTGSLPVAYPAEPLVLRWAPVEGAAKYIVTVASDPSLAQSVIGSKLVETSATAFALPIALAPGAYHWAVQPVDAQGHRGTRSDVGKFVWAWNSSVSLDGQPLELRQDARVDAPTLSDPELNWQPVAGASGYEVEINFFENFSLGSRVLFTKTVAPRVAPEVLLPNNTYHWRVRALDVDGNPGSWSVGAPFAKSLDTRTPSIAGLRMRDNEADPARDRGLLSGIPRVQHPIIRWDPVPGASAYEVQSAPYSTGNPKFCDWSLRRLDTTPTPSWSPLIRRGSNVEPPGPVSWRAPDVYYERDTLNDPAFVDGQAYCIRVLAIAGMAPADKQNVVSDWTYLHNGTGSSTDSNAPAFVYEAAADLPVVDPDHDPRMDADDYLAPADGAVVSSTPTLRWRAVPGARSYWVVVARDAQFTNVSEVTLTREPQHVPRRTFRDESTRYHWVVLPAMAADGGQVTTGIQHNDARSFQKSSAPPAPAEPAADAVVTGQPRFRWSGADGAEHYVLQVSTDPTFKDTSRELDTVRTVSTGYTPTKTYPVDTSLYWRVSAVAIEYDNREVALSPSATRSFRRRLDTPVTAGDNAREGANIPVLRWAPVPGAVGYDIHVDQSDGTRKDFTTRATAFTPVGFYGTGVWRWQVRAVFPGDTHGAYSAPVPFTRFIPAPTHAAAHRTKDRILIRWDRAPMPTAYQVEVSTDSSFTRIIERERTDHTSWAPTLRHRQYRAGGKLFWRVATIDEGKNVGAFASGTLTLAKRLVVTATGRPRAGRPSPLSIRVSDAGRRRVKGAVVRITGPGVSITRRTSRTGVIRVRVRPRGTGTLRITAAKKGYGGGREELRVR